MTDELKKNLAESGRGLIKVLSSPLPGGTEENQVNLSQDIIYSSSDSTKSTGLPLRKSPRPRVYVRKVKGKAIPVTVRGGPQSCETSRLSLF
jgi:hypothetical protein